MSSPSNTKMESRFTRGEKCIFAHAVVTFVLLIVLIIVYFVHLLVVSHSTQDAFITFLRASNIEREEQQPPYVPVGVVHLEPREFMCNCILIRYRWSSAPAHCVVARSDPDLADLLPRWRIQYRTTNEAVTAKFTGTTIRRSIAHPHFNSDDYSNNIGLFEHDEAIPIYSYLYPDKFPLSEKSLKTFSNDLELIGWEDSWFQPDGHVVHNSVRHITLEKCLMYVSPIVELRDYEYCVTLKERRNVSIAPGAVLVLNSKFVGFFSWGESRGRGVPFIIIDLVHFKDWIQNIDETGRLMRRNIVRYAILAYVITLQRVSLRVKRRFPTWQHVVDSGLMLESERKVFEKMDGKSPMSKYWMPLVWATNIINRARKEGLITSDHIVQTLLVELSDIRRRLGALIGYDTVCVPLVYTQVVTLALYTYFVAALMGRQLVPPASGSTSKYEPDVYFPLFTALQFCFYVGWLKVAEVLINPFGEDDDDIELNWLIDRHIKAAYMIVDEMHEEHPELLKDQYWEEVVPKDLPYTVASEHYRRHEPPCSADHYKVKAEDAVYANVQAPRKSHDETYADYESVDTPLVERRKNWFQRQISRMGSVRSASTAYSSGGLFGRNRHNSVVYSSPEAGQPAAPPPPHKMSLYERLVGRKSGRGQHRQNSRHGGQKSNGSAVPVTLRNRPRIPTPDVTKEIIDRENRLAMGMQNMGVIMAHQGYQNEVPVLGALVLSPIQELDSGSVNNTLHAGQPGTTALAQAVLSPALQSSMLTAGPVALSMGVTQLSSLVNSTPSTPRTERITGSAGSGATPPPPRATVTELPPGSDRDSEHSAASTGTPPEFNRKSNSKRGEVYV